MSEPQRVKIDGQRHYQIGDDVYPSVTTVTDAYEPKQQALKQWKARTVDWERERNRAALRGTLAHHRILNPLAIRRLPLPEVDMSMVDDDLRAEVETCLALWDDLAFDVEDSPKVEERIYSHEHGFAGTLDLLTDGTVVDLKTSKAVFDSHKLQIAAYWHACHEMPSVPDPDDAAVIVLHPVPENNPEMTPTVEWLRQPELETWFDTFLDCLSKFRG